MKKIRKNKFGFTLLEMVLVVAVIVVLAGVMTLNIVAYVQRARNAENMESEGRSSAIGMIESNESHLANLGFDRTIAGSTSE